MSCASVTHEILDTQNKYTPSQGAEVLWDPTDTLSDAQVSRSMEEGARLREGSGKNSKREQDCAGGCAF